MIAKLISFSLRNRLVVLLIAAVLFGWGLYSVQTNKAFTIYPNPVKQQLNITSGESLAGGLLRIFDISGKQVMTARPAGNHIDVSALAPGVYTLVFTKNKTRITKEFLK